MKHIDSKLIDSLFSYSEFIPFLKEYFTKEIHVPQRPHYPLNPDAKQSDTLLIMPAWQIDDYIGIKIITVFEGNAQRNLNTINGTYLLFDGNTGIPLCSFNASLLTSKRTAASSALASSFLSREDSKTLTIAGTGNLCHELINAHATVRPIEHVNIWGRNYEKALHKAESLKDVYNCTAVNDISKAIAESDIITSATYAKEAIILGRHVQEGTHVDLVGSYQPGNREADDEVIKKATIYIDTPAALKETGEILIPLSNNIISLGDIKGNLIELCKADKLRRQSDEEITWFKSVGYALEDLAIGIYLYEKIQQNV